MDISKATVILLVFGVMIVSLILGLPGCISCIEKYNAQIRAAYTVDVQ